MRTLGYIVLALMCQACAAANEPQPSERLMLKVKTHDGNPASWLKHYIPSKERSIVIIANFDIEHVKTILISDENARLGKCGDQQTEHLFYLSIDANYSLKSLATRIDKPCLYQRSALLKLQVEDADGHRYYNASTFAIDPLSDAH